MGVDHVFDRWPRIARTVWLARKRIGRRRPGRAAAAADEVRANDEVPVEIDPLAVADQTIPPARALFIGIGVAAGGVRARGERVTDEDRIRFLRVQCAERFVRDRKRRDRLPMQKTKTVRQHELLRRRGNERVERRRRGLHRWPEDNKSLRRAVTRRSRTARASDRASGSGGGRFSYGRSGSRTTNPAACTSKASAADCDRTRSFPTRANTTRAA